MLEGEPGVVGGAGEGVGGHCGPLFTRLKSWARIPVYAVGERKSLEIGDQRRYSTRSDIQTCMSRKEQMWLRSSYASQSSERVEAMVR